MCALENAPATQGAGSRGSGSSNDDWFWNNFPDDPTVLQLTCMFVLLSTHGQPTYNRKRERERERKDTKGRV